MGSQLREIFAGIGFTLAKFKAFFSKFSKFTLSISKSKPQLSLSVVIYCELDNFFKDAKAKEN
jgi:hypothetical protein